MIISLRIGMSLEEPPACLKIMYSIYLMTVDSEDVIQIKSTATAKKIANFHKSQKHYSSVLYRFIKFFKPRIKDTK